jgi:hypothetical protein
MDSINILNNTFTSPIYAAYKVAKDLSKAKFENVDESTSGAFIALLVVGIIIAIAIYILLLISTYRLTDSVLETIICAILPKYYIIIAWLFYGMSSHRLEYKLQ